MNTTDIVIRVAIAVILGGLIGYEREIRNRPAGFRTHILVCLGATIVPMVQLQLIQNNINFLAVHPEMIDVVKIDPGRMVAQVIGGIGFLGAGTIIVHKGAVKGLTTASSLWVVACIGIAIGFGYYEIALIAGGMTLLVIVLFKNLEVIIYERRYTATVFITYYENSTHANLKYIVNYIKKQDVKIADMTFSDKRSKIDSEPNKINTVNLKLRRSGFNKWLDIFKELRDSEFIISIDID